MEYTRVHRLLKIIRLVQSAPDWNVERLAAECGVSDRNLYRDIQQLKGAGIPIEFEKGHNGYRIASEFFLPPVHLTGEEALALSLLCEEVAEREQIAFLKPAWRALSKIEAQLPSEIRGEIDALRGHMAIKTAAANPPDGHIDVYDKVRAAIASRTALQCVYESVRSESDGETFLFEPYALFFGVRAWYAVGRHDGRDAIRSLKLSRFAVVQHTETAYEIPDGFSIDEHLGNAWRMIRGDEEHAVELRFDASFGPTIVDTVWHKTQEWEEHADGSATLRFRVHGLDEIVWWVLGMGPHCEVLAPEELRERVRDLAARTAALYPAPDR